MRARRSMRCVRTIFKVAISVSAGLFSELSSGAAAIVVRVSMSSPYSSASSSRVGSRVKLPMNAAYEAGGSGAGCVDAFRPDLSGGWVDWMD